MSEPSATPPINPYAPVTDASAADRLSPKINRTAVSGGNIVWTTIGGITLSGGVFGFGTVMVFAIWSWSQQSGPDGEVIFIAMMGFFFGMFLALVASLFIAPIAYFICVATDLVVKKWNGRTIRIYGAVCGFLSGFVSLALPTGLDPTAVMVAFIPGVVGALGTALVLTPLARRTDKALALEVDLDNELSFHAAPTDDIGLAANPFASDCK